MEEEYKVKQIQPAHADHVSHYKDKWLNDMFYTDSVIAQRKYDGERMLIHFNKSEVYCTSRRFSKKTGRYMENQSRIKDLPHLQNFDYTVIDCECYADTWSEAASILHSLPERAIELQKTINLRFAVFDCLFFNGIDIRERPYCDRFNMIAGLLALINDNRFHIADSFLCTSIDDMKHLAKQQWDMGNEGIVVKSLRKKYYDVGAMIKVKRFETVDCIVYDYQQGRGKYCNTVGALLVGYYDKDADEVIHCSKVNCGTDNDRNWWKEYFDKYSTSIGNMHVLTRDKLLVVELKCQEVTDRSLRHPIYIRLRQDKSYKMCTKETIFKE